MSLNAQHDNRRRAVSMALAAVPILGLSVWSVRLPEVWAGLGYTQ